MEQVFLDQGRQDRQGQEQGRRLRGDELESYDHVERHGQRSLECAICRHDLGKHLGIRGLRGRYHERKGLGVLDDHRTGLHEGQGQGMGLEAGGQVRTGQNHLETLCGRTRPCRLHAGLYLGVFGKHNMRQIIDARNSELARPAIGISVVSSSLLALTNCLAEEDTDQDKKFQEALQEMRRLFSGEDGTAFRKACDTLCKDRSNQNSAEKRRKAVEIWVGFFRKHKDTLQKALPPMLSRASLLYMSGMQALESCTLTNALGNWSNKIPNTVANEASLSKWQASPKTLKLLVDYLAEALGQRQADDTAWKQAHGGWGGDSDDDAEADDGRDTWGIPATEGRKRKTTSQSSSTTSSKRRRKAAKKAEKRKAKKAAKAGKDTHREELPSLEADDVEAR